MKIQRTGNEGFTLTEMMIVVAIIGLLAMIAMPGFLHAREKARSAAFISNLRTAGGAFEMFTLENHYYPPNAAAGVVPTGMASYLARFPWTATTPIGGRWNWDNQINGYRAGVAVTSVSADVSQMYDIDTAIDDGSLSVGQFRTRPSGYVYVIEE